MTQSPQRGQTAPPSSDFGSVTTQRSAASTGSSNGTGADTDARTTSDLSKSDANATAQWGTSPFGGSSSSTATDPALPTAPGSPAAARDAKGSFAEATTGSLRTDPNGPPQGAPLSAPAGAPVAPPPPGERPASKGRPSRGTRPRGPRRARLQLRNINPWTVLKFSCVLSIALFFVWLIVIGVLFGVLDGAGIIGKINDTVTTINGAGSKPPITAGVVFGGAAIIGVVNVVLFIALSTVGSVVYNLCADLVGGIEVTLSER